MEIPPISEITREDIEKKILQGNPFHAIQDINHLVRKGSVISDTQLVELAKNAENTLRRLFDVSLNSHDYLRALAVFSSFKPNLKKELESVWTESSLLVAEAERLLKNG